nr:serine/arginine-rich splicing factor 2-like isoform X1 [Physcomitrium patens]|eukprot:XP_024386168.1 serine/arginine-rich splicing factor 2-like isoform X1 [Physcomitrella patens]
MDDANSVHVGGLSYESSEDAVKKAFIEFGEVVSVKIVYDRESGESRGFGFVSFTNPRSATMAIRDMDGGQIEGRTIRVNEVRKNLKGLGFRDRDRDFRSRGMKERIRRRGSLPSRERMHHRTRSPVPQRSRSPTPVKSSPAAIEGSPRRGNSPFVNAGRYQSAELKEREWSHGTRSSVSPPSSEGNEIKEESLHKEVPNLSSRIAAEKDEEDVRNLLEELENAKENRRGLEEKVASLRSVVEKAVVTIAALKSKSQKLEECLANAQQLTAHRQFQLKRLKTGVFQYKLCTERLSSSEKEMKALAALASLEADHSPRSNSNPDESPPCLPNGHFAGDEQNHYDGDQHTNLFPAYTTKQNNLAQLHAKACDLQY